MNTYNPALNIIRQKGYRIYLWPDSREEFYGDYWAIKDGHDFIATDPLRLLSLITIWETYGERWQPKDNPYEDIKDEVASIAFPDDAYLHLSDEQFSVLMEYMVPFFEAIEVKFEKSPTREEVFAIFNRAAGAED